MEVIDAEAPVITPLSDQQILAERAKANVESVVEHELDPGPSKSFNDIASKLDAALKEVRTQAQQKPQEQPKETAKEEPKAEAKEPKAEVKAEPDPADKTITSAKAADWKALKERREAAEKTAKEFQQKLELTTKEYEEFRKQAVPTKEIEKMKAEIEAMQKERDRLADELKVVAVERSDRFTQYFKSKFDTAITRAKEAVGEGNAEKIEQLMQLPPSKWRKERINEIRETLELGTDQGQLDQAIAAYETVRAERDAELKDSKTNYARLQDIQQQQAQTEKEMAQRRQEAALNAVLNVARTTSESFKPNEDEKHNLFVRESEEFLQKFFRKQLSDSDVSTLPILAREARRYQEMVVPVLEKQVAELKEALKQYQGATPTGGEGKAQVAVPSQNDDFISKFNKLWPAGNR